MTQGKDKRQLVIRTELVNIEKKKIYKVKAIIDSGITGNFILPDIISIFEIDTRIKIISYKLLVINKKAINVNKGIMDIKIKELIIEISEGISEVYYNKYNTNKII